MGGNLENLIRSIKSVEPWCDETFIVWQPLFEDDEEEIRSVASKVAVVDWNYVFHRGYGALPNVGAEHIKNPWLLYLGVAETIAEEYQDINKLLADSSREMIYRVDHHNDANRWNRWYAPQYTKYSGIMHESTTAGPVGAIIARMQDTEKTPLADPLKNECLKYFKACSYNFLYRCLLEDNSRLGATDSGWIQFVNGAKESILDFCAKHSDLLEPAIYGDRQGFIDGVKRRMDAGKEARGVNFNPQGEEMSVGA